MAARTCTNCCSRRSASPPTAGRCTRRSRGTGSGWRRSCARTARSLSCPAARRRTPATSVRAARRWPRRCAPSRAMARRRSTKAPIAADMVATLRARGGLHTEEDFAAGLHNAEFVEPITLNWNGYDVYQCPPNGQGIVALMILGMLGGMPSAPGRPVRRAALSSPHRGRAPGLSRPRCVRCRSGAGGCAGEEAAERGVSRRRCAG